METTRSSGFPRSWRWSLRSVQFTIRIRCCSRRRDVRRRRRRRRRRLHCSVRQWSWKWTRKWTSCHDFGPRFSNVSQQQFFQCFQQQTEFRCLTKITKAVKNNDKIETWWNRWTLSTIPPYGLLHEEKHFPIDQNILTTSTTTLQIASSDQQ